MKETDYTIKEENNRLSVYENGTLVSKGCLTEDDALHSIWVLNHKPQDLFYVVSDGVVAVIDRGIL